MVEWLVGNSTCGCLHYVLCVPVGIQTSPARTCFYFLFRSLIRRHFLPQTQKNKKPPPTKIFIDKFFFREAVNHFTRFSFPIKSTHSKLTKDGNGILGTATFIRQTNILLENKTQPSLLRNHFYKRK